MMEFTKEEGERFVRAAIEGDADVILSLRDRHKDGTNARRGHSYNNVIFDRSAYYAAINGHVHISKLLSGYGQAQKHHFPELIMKQRWEVLDWLTNKEGEKDWIRYGGSQMPLTPIAVRNVLLRAESEEEFEAALQILKGYFPEDFPQEMMLLLREEYI
jgi:hypothetical protein